MDVRVDGLLVRWIVAWLGGWIVAWLGGWIVGWVVGRSAISFGRTDSFLFSHRFQSSGQVPQLGALFALFLWRVSLLK